MNEMTDIEVVRQFLGQVFAFNPESPLLFTQFYFWAFFAVVFAVFSLLHKRKMLRNLFLFAASSFFYYKTSGLCLLILWFCTCSDYLIAKRIDRSRKEGARKAWVALSVTVNLLLLAFFKYSYFVTDLVNTIFGTDFAVFNIFAYAGNRLLGSDLRFVGDGAEAVLQSINRFSVDRIILPVGISFYIFQTISYTMDVYRRRVRPVNNLIDYGFYVSFFPQLVAGPIVRASDFIPQIYKPFHLSRRQFGIAVFWILNGLAKKIILSDYLAVNFIDRIFSNPTMYSGFENLSALFAYSLQVYADFSGYTDIAIGVAMLMGFYLPRNFNSPYKAPNAGNFWKRWHISLSRWLQDYLYIPLGGSRKATFGTYFFMFLISMIAVALSRSLWVLIVLVLVFGISLIRTIGKPQERLRVTTNMNSMNTMLIGGLWHGASLNFVIWGGLNGLGCVIYKSWKRWSPLMRMCVLICLFAGAYVAQMLRPSPALNIAVVWIGVLCAATVIRYLFHVLGKVYPRLNQSFIAGEKGMGKVWGIAQTFVFITFTRLFFRSGSNLDPAEANRVAWQTATDMISQIGSHWDLSLIPQMLHEYRNIFLLFAFGMIVHWLPDRFKRRYRIWFSRLPLWLMAIVVVVAVFVLYQFITSDLQAFIYFQF